MMEQRRRADPAALRAGARRLGRRRRLRRRGALGHLHGRRARHPVRPRAVPRRSPRCPAASRSGSRWRRCCAARTRCCCSTSRTTTSTCRASGGWRSGCSRRPKTVLLVSHDRELLARTANRIVTVEAGIDLGARRRLRVVPRGPAASGTSGSTSCAGAGTRSTPSSRRWCSCTSRRRRTTPTWPAGYQAAVTRLERFEEAGPPEERPEGAEGQDAAARRAHRPARGDLRAARAHRADEAVRPRGLLRRAGRGARLQRLGQVALPAAARRLADDRRGRAHRRWKLGARVVPGHFAQTHERPELAGRTPLEILWDVASLQIDGAAPALSRYELAGQRDQRFETLSGGQQARFQILLLELEGSTLLLLDEPTDNLDLASAEALETGLAAYEGTVIAVTHDRWFARSFDRFLVFGSDGGVYEAPEPVWDEGRVSRPRSTSTETIAQGEAGDYPVTAMISARVVSSRCGPAVAGKRARSPRTGCRRPSASTSTVPSAPTATSSSSTRSRAGASYDGLIAVRPAASPSEHCAAASAGPAAGSSRVAGDPGDRRAHRAALGGGVEVAAADRRRRAAGRVPGPPPGDRGRPGPVRPGPVPHLEQRRVLVQLVQPGAVGDQRVVDRQQPAGVGDVADPGVGWSPEVDPADVAERVGVAAVGRELLAREQPDAVRAAGRRRARDDG